MPKASFLKFYLGMHKKIDSGRGLLPTGERRSSIISASFKRLDPVRFSGGRQYYRNLNPLMKSILLAAFLKFQASPLPFMTNKVRIGEQLIDSNNVLAHFIAKRSKLDLQKEKGPAERASKLDGLLDEYWILTAQCFNFCKWVMTGAWELNLLLRLYIANASENKLHYANNPGSSLKLDKCQKTLLIIAAIIGELTRVCLLLTCALIYYPLAKLSDYITQPLYFASQFAPYCSFLLTSSMMGGYYTLHFYDNDLFGACPINMGYEAIMGAFDITVLPGLDQLVQSLGWYFAMTFVNSAILLTAGGVAGIWITCAYNSRFFIDLVRSLAGKYKEKIITRDDLRVEGGSRDADLTGDDSVRARAEQDRVEKQNEGGFALNPLFQATRTTRGAITEPPRLSGVAVPRVKRAGGAGVLPPLPCREEIRPSLPRPPSRRVIGNALPPLPGLPSGVGLGRADVEIVVDESLSSEDESAETTSVSHSAGSAPGISLPQLPDMSPVALEGGHGSESAVSLGPPNEPLPPLPRQVSALVDESVGEQLAECALSLFSMVRGASASRAQTPTGLGHFSTPTTTRRVVRRVHTDPIFRSFSRFTRLPSLPASEPRRRVERTM